MIKRTFQLAMLASLALGVSSHVNAQTFTDGGGDGLWSNTANWDGGALPTGNVVVGNGTFPGVTAEFDVATSSIGDIRIAANDGDGTLNMAAGAMSLTGWAFVGSDNTAATTGTLNLSGSASINLADGDGRFYSGLNGDPSTSTSVINISDSASLTSDQSIFGSNAGSVSTVNQSGGTVTSNSWTTVGEAGGAQSTYNLSGGAFTAGSDLTIGQADAGTTGTFNVSGTGNATVNAGLFVGRGQFGAGGAVGDLNMDGSTGSFLVNGDVHFGGFDFAAADAEGGLSFVADAGGVTTLDIAGSLFLNDGTGVGSSNLMVDLSADAAFSGFGTPGTTIEYLLVDNINNGVTGTFAGLAEGSTISIGGGKTGVLSYVGGDGNDIVVLLEVVPEPSTALFVTLGLAGLAMRRRRS